eukprot:CAMPEP_0175949856 /NCGR_PEP_ID=MMETSP0108-20121206/29273_1 /TAXON_ID=195067 ORGANISM="Goniomonas pacifica, Strain CCMP1869" /NCGR_SAMPLE_ID=MMETSP0108 /ASSEMBLY_ACC=CAM_ASM_000204 /LENGTH=259 /DNA_ID=CAMNT_0017275843 /DNA_START=1 /DNA_END=781 /DNA_ORIENTATION=-
MRALVLAFAVSVVAATPQESLMSAILQGSDDPAAVKAALAAGGKINERLESAGGQTPLMAATLSGKPKIVEFLLQQNADASIPEKDGYTPFHGAGFQGRALVAKHLLKHGLDPNDFHRDGFAPLHRACWGGSKRHNQFIKVLLEQPGFDVDIPSGAGTTGLMEALARGHTKTAKLLVRAGADLNKTDKQGRTAAQYAQQAGVLEELQKLQKKAELYVNAMSDVSSLSVLVEATVAPMPLGLLVGQEPGIQLDAARGMCL